MLDELAAEIDKHPKLFERLFYKADLTSLHSRALLFLPTDQIRQVQAHIKGMSLLLEPPVLGGSIRLRLEVLKHPAAFEGKGSAGPEVWKVGPTEQRRGGFLQAARRDQPRGERFPRTRRAAIATRGRACCRRPKGSSTMTYF